MQLCVQIHSPKSIASPRWLWRTVLAAVLVAQAVFAAPREFYVAPNGDDAQPGTIERPFATVQRAMRAVRGLRRTGPVTVYLRGGTFTLTEKLVFGPEDTGTKGSPVTYASYPGEHAVISGGRRIKGKWTKAPGKPYWQVTIPGARGGRWVFNSLFVNGVSRTRARMPNWGQKVFRAKGRAPGEDPRQAFEYLPGDIDPAWTNLRDVDLVLLCSWTPTIHRITDVAPRRRVVRFHSSHGRPVDAWEKHFRYYVMNVFEALDAPGEWYLNRQTGVLYYYPMPGENMARAEVVAPVVKSTLIEFHGDASAGRPITHLRFQELGFKHVDGDLDRYNGLYRQGHMFLSAAIYAEGLQDSVFVGCEIAQVGEYAMELEAGCQRNRIERCHIWDTGAGAMQIGITDLRAALAGRTRVRKSGLAPEAEESRSKTAVLSNVIDNSFIHRTGTIWHGCYGIVNRFASFTHITHNEITDTHWDAIGLDARWSYQGEKYSHGNVVAYNHLHHLGLGYLTDAGAVYQFGPLDTHIHHNLIHDTIAYPYMSGFTGVYLDQQSRGAVVENNLVYQVDSAAYTQNIGTDNTFRNNIGAFARDGFIMRGSVNKRWKVNHFEATRNIYITRDKVAIKRSWAPGLKPPVLRQNMYFRPTERTALTFAGLSLAEWKAKGLDQGSAVCDPGCKDPMNLDFSLRPDAPAVKAIGFKPFDHEIRKAGLYGDSEWVNLPKKYKPRPLTPAWTEKELQRFLAFSLDFEDMPDGYEPNVFRLAKQGDATFAVTSEAACTGRKSLRCVDRKGLRKPFYPYIHIAPRRLTRGKITLAFDVMNSKRSPARFYVEMRGKGFTDDIGPSLHFTPDGAFVANGRRIAMTRPGVWRHVEVRFELGESAAREYTLVTRGGNEETRQTVPFMHATFSEIRWLGISAAADADGVFYLDNMEFKVEASKKIDE